MFVLCPHCQFLVGVDPRTGAPPATCPKCGGALDALDAVGADAPAAAAEAPAPALDAAGATAAPEPVDATAGVPATGTDPASEPHPVPGTPLAPDPTATGPSADDLVAAMAARPPRGVRKRAASDPPRHAATDTGRRRARAPTPAPVPSPARDDASTATAGDHGPRAAADGTASGGWWQRWRRRLARPAAAPAAGPAPAAVVPAPAPAGTPAEAPPDTAASASPSAAAPAAAGAAPHDSGTTTPQAAATAASAARGWRGWRLGRNASQPEPVPATPAPGVASTSTSTATLPGTADAEGAPATTPASASAVASAPAAATTAPVEAAPLPSMASPVDAGTDARTVPPTAGPDPAHADAAPHADREVSRHDGDAPSAVATPADPAPAAVAEVAPFLERRRPPEVIARDGAPPGHPLRRRTDPAPSFARAQAAPAPGGRRWIPLAVAAVLGVLLVLQLLLAQRATLAADARWRPVLAGLCRVLPCTLPPWREPAAFTMLSRDVRAHPQVPGALLVDASFRNDARWPQPWPRVVLTLSNVEGRVVGARAFQARDYLGDESATTQTTLAPGQTAAIRLAIVEPAPDVVAFSFDFR